MRSESPGADTLEILLATSYLKRLQGLLFTDPDDLAADALVLAPCSAVHTLLMRYPIDLAFLGSDGAVLGAIRRVEPWRWRIACPGAVAVMERPSIRVGWWPSVGERVVLSVATQSAAPIAAAALAPTAQRNPLSRQERG